MNITVSVDEAVVRQVRKIAIDRQTTMAQLVRDYLTNLARTADQDAARRVRDLEATYDAATGSSGGERWTRDELHER